MWEDGQGELSTETCERNARFILEIQLLPDPHENTDEHF